MHGSSIVVLDIETVPDFTVWQPDPDKKEKSPFPPHHAHIPIVIGTTRLSTSLEPLEIKAFTIDSEFGEKKLLAEWSAYMAEHRPKIVTWWGRGFDMPVLTLRSLRHGVNLSWYFAENYRYRYSEDNHSDLCDVMGDFGMARNLKLDVVGKLIGLPGKHGVDGSQVAEMYAQGGLKDIERYCITDVFQTAVVYMRWRMLKGKLTVESYRDKLAQLIAMLGEREGNKDFLGAIDPRRLQLAEDEPFLPIHPPAPTPAPAEPENVWVKVEAETPPKKRTRVKKS